jgi:DNA polymerase-1|tara:strand:+ start:913 stop:3591 length:2679 start_codon:yes stop_codon:yes gene_type:complete
LVKKNEDFFIIVDGSSYLYRAFYALPHLKNSAGLHTGAIVGFANMTQKILSEYQPKYISMIFDARGKNFRHKIYKEYKSNRKSMPQELSEQVEPILQFVESLGINIIQQPDVEADDVIASLVNKFSSTVPILISTGDKDLAQLVTKNVHIINSMNDTLLDPKGVLNKFGVKPEQILDYLTLVGDTSDNIPGVDKVGPKTAVKLLKEYGSVDNIVKNVSDLKQNLKTNIENSLDKINLAKELIALKSDLKVDENITSYSVSGKNEEKLNELTLKYELRKISKDLGLTTKPSINKKEVEYVSITDIKSLEVFKKKLLTVKIFSFDTETTSLDPMVAEIAGVSFSFEANKAVYIPINHKNLKTEINMEILENFLKDIFNIKSNTVVCQNIKYEMNVLRKYNIAFSCKYHDTMIMSYIFNSNGKHDLSTLSSKYLNHESISYEDVVGKGSKQILFNELLLEEAITYACEDADITLQLYNYLLDKLSSANDQYELYKNIELPLVSVIADIEYTGVKVNSEDLNKQSRDLRKRIQLIEKKVYDEAGQEFNIGSPKQIQEIFYDVLKLPVLKKTPKGAPSTNEDVMNDLSEIHDLPKLILEYRNLSKLKNTYTDRLGEQVSEISNRLHTSYNQTVTITGRLSSSNPNLQNIPVRNQDGRNIRKAFIPEKGYKILSADYSQIELRIMSHLSQDETLKQNFMDGEDIHMATAREVFKSKSQPTKEDRRAAKAINFGLIYGISSYGLAKQLRIDNSSAKEYIDRYFKKYEGVRDFMEDTKKQAKKNGFVETMKGRKIYLPNISHSNFQVRSAAERTAINAPIQGTAADILKIAMLDISKWMQNHQDKVKLLMQVHDELVFEIDIDFIDKASKKIKALMSNCVSIDVPLDVDLGVGNNWDKAH